MKDIAGQRFGQLVALTGFRQGRYTFWVCQCDCGKKAYPRRDHLISGGIQSCGCLHDKGRPIRHGHKRVGQETSIYRRWAHMMDRCYNPKNSDYHRYGGRGITVCDYWHVFENFLADMGEPPEGMTIDRKDNNLGYSKGNCRWATATVQANNRRARI